MIVANLENLHELWAQLRYETEDQSHVPLGELYDTLGNRTFGLMLLGPALVAASPLSLIPGVPAVAAALILLIALQAMLGKRSPWVPGWALDLAIPQARLEVMDRKLHPWLVWSAKFTHPRLRKLVSPPMFQQVAAFCAMLAFSFYPLALVPLAVTGPALAIVFFALALAARDGGMVIAGGLVTATTIALVIYFWT
jgi:hypothetical protein